MRRRFDFTKNFLKSVRFRFPPGLSIWVLAVVGILGVSAKWLAIKNFLLYLQIIKIDFAAFGQNDNRRTHIKTPHFHAALKKNGRAVMSMNGFFGARWGD